MSLKHFNLILAAAVLLAAGGLSSCKQTRTLPNYEPMLVMRTNSPSYVHYAAPHGSSAMTLPTKVKGGG
jgi:ABC-type oligopeptide transport system substrate-binding subunit